MRIQLKEIRDFAQCPRYYYYQRDVDEVPRSFRTSIFEFVLKRCHMQASETGYRAGWRSIVGWVDSQIFKQIDIENKEVYEQARKNSEHILVGLQKWYRKYYLNEHYESYVDIDLWGEAGDHYVGGRIPIIQVAEPPIITIIQDTSSSPIEMYNDLVIRGLICLAIGALEYKNIQARLITIGPRGAFEVVEQRIDIDTSLRAWDTIKQIARLIAQRVDYVSRTEQCKSCTFIRRCRL